MNSKENETPLYFIIFNGFKDGCGYKPDWRYLMPDTGNGHLHAPCHRREDLALKTSLVEANKIITKLKKLGFKEKFEPIEYARMKAQFSPNNHPSKVP